VIDEVDAFSQLQSSQAAFTTFLKRILTPDCVVLKQVIDKILVCGVTVIGIANSIELFKGELTSSSTSMSKSKLICNNELKIIFSPYSRPQVASILKDIASAYVEK
jgi:hypothetical protein